MKKKIYNQNKKRSWLNNYTDKDNYKNINNNQMPKEYKKNQSNKKKKFSTKIKILYL